MNAVSNESLGSVGEAASSTRQTRVIFVTGVPLASASHPASATVRM